MSSQREQLAWMVLASPTAQAELLQKEAGLMSSLGKAVSYAKGGPSLGQRMNSAAGAYRAARKATMTSAEKARVAANRVPRRAAKLPKAAPAAVANKGAGTGYAWLDKAINTVAERPLLAGAAAVGLPFLAHQGIKAFKAYNSPMGRAARFAKANPLVTGAGLLGGGLALKGMAD